MKLVEGKLYKLKRGIAEATSILDLRQVKRIEKGKTVMLVRIAQTTHRDITDITIMCGKELILAKFTPINYPFWFERMP